MDLKDAVLSTLAELDEFEEEPFVAPKQQQPIYERPQQRRHSIQEVQEVIVETFAPSKPSEQNMQKFLVSLRERILVLFEGLQTINNSNNSETLNLEKKLDLTINFLEFMLASIEDKLEVAPE
jgi:hypothetical protein